MLSLKVEVIRFVEGALPKKEIKESYETPVEGWETCTTSKLDIVKGWKRYGRYSS